MDLKLITKIALALMCLSITVIEGQFSRNDITIMVSGLSEEYASRFKSSENKYSLVDDFNKINITGVIKPIIIKVSYADGEGMVTAEINFSQDRAFTENSDNGPIYNLESRGEKGINLNLQTRIFNALYYYKRAVATNGVAIDRDLMKFDTAIKMKKSNGDWIFFYAADNPSFLYNSHFLFYNNVHINIGGKIYEAESINTEALNKYLVFVVGKTRGLDGSKTSAYYFCKFFKIKTE